MKYLRLPVMLVALASMLLVPITSMSDAYASGSECVDIILDFSQLSHGDLEDKINGQLAQFGILVQVDAFPGNSGAGFDKPQIFDTSQTNTADPDLESFAALNALDPNFRNVLIIPEDNGVYPPAEPDDAAKGGEVTFHFLWKRNIGDLVFVDADRENGKTAKAYDGSGGLIKSVGIPDMGEGSVQVISVDAMGAKKLVINYADSGAIGPIELDCYENTPANCEGATSGTADIAVKSSDLFGDLFPGQYVEIDCGTGTPLFQDFTEYEAELDRGVLYRICIADFDIWLFSSWLHDGSDYKCTLIIPSGDGMLTGIFDSGRPAEDPNAPQVSLMVTAVDEATNDQINGMWTMITTYGIPVANGFTQVNQQVSSGVLYTVCMGEWPGFDFAQWADGDTNPCKNVVGGNNLPDAEYETT